MTTKRRVEVKPNDQVHRHVPIPAALPVQVVAESGGAVTVLDRIKAYYHTALAVVGILAVFAPLAAVIGHLIPGPIGVGIAGVAAVLTPLSIRLKSNETWVDNA